MLLMSRLVCLCVFVFFLYFFLFLFFFFFKQKTAYEMRISDLSSDVCSSDLKISSGMLSNTLCPAGSVISKIASSSIFYSFWFVPMLPTVCLQIGTVRLRI